MRQLVCWPRKVMAGTPTTLAIVRPDSTNATAWPRFCGPKSVAATSAATPKYAPCGSAARKRKATTDANVGASADATVSVVNAIASATSRRLRGKRAANAAMVGAPTTTPAAYAVIIQPAEAMAASWFAAHSSGRKSRAISGRRPIATNSVVPMPKPPSASASSARRARAGLSPWDAIGVPASAADAEAGVEGMGDRSARWGALVAPGARPASFLHHARGGHSRSRERTGSSASRRERLVLDCLPADGADRGVVVIGALRAGALAHDLAQERVVLLQARDLVVHGALGSVARAGVAVARVDPAPDHDARRRARGEQEGDGTAYAVGVFHAAPPVCAGRRGIAVSSVNIPPPVMPAGAARSRWAT